MNKKLYSVILMTILLVSLFSLTTIAQEDEQTLVIGFEADVSSLDPGFADISVNERVNSLIYDGLVEYGENNKIVPGIAQDWDISEDGKTYTFYLQEGIEFHNGETLTAEDVKFTYERILDPDNGSGLRGKVTIIDQIEVVDEHTIKFKLDKPYSPFMLAMTFGIVPKDYVQEIGSDQFSRKPIGAGPFKLEEWVPDTRIVLTANESYWMKKPKLDKVIIRPIPESSVQAMELRSGGIDVAVNLDVGQLENFQENSNFQVKKAAGGGVHFFGFNDKMAPFNNVEFRKAFLMASPLEQITPQIYGPKGETAYSFIPPTLWPDERDYLKEQRIEFNPSKAQEKLQELKDKGVVEEDFTIDIYVPSSDSSRVKVVEALVSSLRDAGFKANAQVMEFGAMWEKLGAGEIGVYMLSFVSDPDPEYWLYRWFKSDGSLNKSFYENDQVDEWLDKARTSSDQSVRQEMYSNVLRKTIGDDKVLVPVAHINQIYVMNNNVQGLKPGNPVIIPLVTPNANVYKD
ncbi:MAG: ABC transporter substrate-binding protein [Halanaerobiales bacterium]|nr:ABC transporter substrate-binding protein [Halanaerobiales bacterium]